MMESGSEDEIGKNINQGTPGGSKRPKRQMKTPFQLEMLEKTYAMGPYPSEVIRAELSAKLGLTDRQLQMWFCHRRLKDKKDTMAVDKKETTAVAPTKRKTPLPVGRRRLAEPLVDQQVVAYPESGRGSDSGSSLGSESGSGEFRNDDDTPNIPHRDSPGTFMEHRVIACVEAQLGEPIRQDGPILGVEFDDLPPGAFGAPIASGELQDGYRLPYDSKLFSPYDPKTYNAAKVAHHDMLEAKIRLGHSNQSYMDDLELGVSCPKHLSLMQEDRSLSLEPAAEGQETCVDAYAARGKQLQFPSASAEDLNANNGDDLHLARKRKGDETRTGKDVHQANEKKIRKEIEKQDQLRRKRDEQLRKEKERLHRERRKEEQRIMKEQQRQEERLQREERREIERREKIMQKEQLRAERRKQKEEHRREKEEARQKAAMERAAAQRIAKESMGLIEDERLELMDLAASRNGLASIFSMDYDTLENLDSFRDALCQFPPRVVQLRKPFAIKPWLDSDKNVGNLLMVWKFCVTFADVLGLWPFTLDEFLQAFHDNESRLLGEINIAVLKLIIKDIVDVMRTPSGGPGTNQYTAINFEGGHPRIVEGGYLWGFDIRNWQKYLNPLTWPEILRQFGLSAGFGPQLKKKAVNHISVNQMDEAKGCEEVVSTLRSGSAAENAFAMMQEKGLTLQRKSRHRLTPGTVKFAAYHVLALEGSKGLNVIDLADKIQKSGLRDLRTSKTPEASISVALSRDPVLFERVAPSTYCVRPAFRKDPSEAASLISAAKEKIQKYANVLLAGQNADDEERDDDSDSDVAEGVDFDASPMTASVGKSGGCKDSSSHFSNFEDKLHVDAARIDTGGLYAPDRGFEIDESISGEAWVLGLTEGDYSDLSVEERLNALVALIGIANEGNSTRVILEERMDASNALKKQMWAEAQLDKRRMKEEVTVTKFNDSFNAVAEGGISPFIGEDRVYNPSASTSKEDPSVMVESLYAPIENLPQDVFTGLSVFPGQQNGCMTEKSRLQLKSYIGHIAEEQYAYRSLPLGQDRRRNRYWQFVASASCLDPGSGRIFVETVDGRWSLLDSVEAFDALLSSLDTRGIRESHLHTMLKKIEDCFKKYIRIYRRNAPSYHKMSQQGTSEVDCRLDEFDGHHGAVCGSSFDALESSCSFRVDTGRNETEVANLLKRNEDLREWMVKGCFNPSVLHSMAHEVKRCEPLFGICNACHTTYDGTGSVCASCNQMQTGSLSERFSSDSNLADETGSSMLNSSPLRVRLIKAILTLLEATVPLEALHASWTEERRRTWALEMQKSSSIEDLFQVLAQFEGAIRRDHISKDFETTEELLCHCDPLRVSDSKSIYFASAGYLPWLPKSSAAVALRLLELDGSVCYNHVRKDDSVDEKDAKPEGSPKEEGRGHLLATPGSFKPRQMAHGRGGRPNSKLQRRGVSSIASSSRRIVKASDPSRQTESQRSVKLSGHAAHGRGRRTVRRRRSENRAIPEFGEKDDAIKTGVPVPRSSAAETRRLAARNALVENDGSSNASDSGDTDENGNAGTDGAERWDAAGYSFTPNRSRGYDTQIENGYDDDAENAEEIKDEGESMEDEDIGPRNEEDSGVSGDYSD